MKGIILAGGTGSRLYPLTAVVSKQLQAVFDKPMVYYPLTTLLECGVRDLCLISTPQDLPRFAQLLGDGTRWGISLQYIEQPQPGGLPEAFLLAESFIAKEPVVLVLGDNIFSDCRSFANAIEKFRGGATIFAQQRQNTEGLGVLELDSSGRVVSIEEKPKDSRSIYVVPGIYLYDRDVSDVSRQLQRSARGELEIADLNRRYLQRGHLQVQILDQENVWIDAGTSSNLQMASVFVEAFENARGAKLGCPEEAAFRKNWISRDRLRELARQMPKSEYRAYLERIVQRP